mmetsp:Transcript_15264/g.23072  ORF Transcript_15264/g.23072 Transcript_15264/m.23072 type:complete len:357 (-) Transcript_15264:448-1518(-)
MTEDTMSNSSDGDNVNDNQHQQTEEQTMDTTSSSEDTVLKNSSLNSRDSIVRFNELRIREYNLIPCQNPFCSSGCPVSMGWRIQRETSISLDEYEQHRPPRRGNLQMPADVRQDLLMREWDVPFSAIRQTIQETSAERELRMKSQRKLSRKKSKMKKMQLLGKVFSCVPKLVSVSGSFKKSKFMSRKEAKDLELGSTRMKQAQQSPKKNSPKRNANSTNIQADAMSSLMKASCYRRYSNEFRLPTDQTLPTEAEAIESQLEQPEDDTGLGLAKSESADSVDSHTCSFETKQDNDDDEEEDDSTLETDEDGSPLEIEKDSDLSMTSLRDLSDDLSVELEGLDVTQRRTNSIGIMLAA